MWYISKFILQILNSQKEKERMTKPKEEEERTKGMGRDEKTNQEQLKFLKFSYNNNREISLILTIPNL